MWKAFKVAVGLALCPIFTPSSAQITYDGCVDFRRSAVASMANPGLPDVAMATYTPDGTAVIIYNPQVLAWMSSATRRFFYAHECAQRRTADLRARLAVRREERVARQRFLHTGQDRGRPVRSVRTQVAVSV